MSNNIDAVYTYHHENNSLTVDLISVMRHLEMRGDAITSPEILYSRAVDAHYNGVSPLMDADRDAGYRIIARDYYHE